MAWQTLYDEATCEAFKASQPLCFGEGHGDESGRCPEAEIFQLVMDRDRDLDRTYAAGDFTGVAQNLYQEGAVLSLRLSLRTDIAQVYKDLADVDVERVPRKILAKFLDSHFKPQFIIHELGSWEKGGDVARYTRWVYSGEPYNWQIETDVGIQEVGSSRQLGNHARTLDERYMSYSKLFETGNISGLVADLYTDDALLALTSGNFVEHNDLESVLSQIYDADPHRTFDVVSSIENDGADVVHDVGTSDSHNYYCRWEKIGEEWKIAVQVLDCCSPTSRVLV